jgi:hypothetical protein
VLRVLPLCSHPLHCGQTTSFMEAERE